MPTYDSEVSVLKAEAAPIFDPLYFGLIKSDKPKNAPTLLILIFVQINILNKIKCKKTLDHSQIRVVNKLTTK